jgi:kynurenine formamidase
MCELCYVDEAIKGKIIARNSEFHKVASSPFGEDDEAGMLNLIDAESRTAILRRADPTKVYDLSVDHFIGMPGWTGAGDQPYQIWMTHTPQGEIVGDSMKKGREANSLVAYSGDGISMYTHCGTHIDTFNHFGYDGAIFNNFTAHDHLGSRAWRKCGAEKQPPIFARGILLDIAGMQGVATLEASHAIGEKDLVDCLKHQKTQLRSGDVVLIRTGQMNLWPDQKFVMNTPGLNREGAAFLAKSGAITIGADNLTLEQTPATDPINFFPVHTYLLAEAGVPIIEIMQLDELAADKVWEFAFFGACIKLRGATGAPMRPVAMPLVDSPII